MRTGIMWNPATIAALSAGIVAVLGAATTLVATWRHNNDPNAHNGQGHAQ